MAIATECRNGLLLGFEPRPTGRRPYSSGVQRGRTSALVGETPHCAAQYSALRASPLRGRLAGVLRRYAPQSVLRASPGALALCARSTQCVSPCRAALTGV